MYRVSSSRTTASDCLSQPLAVFPVDTRRRFNVDTTSQDVLSTLKQRHESTGLIPEV